jgi:prepilin-type N-terminal cleavage/methylation domain-containing protein
MSMIRQTDCAGFTLFELIVSLSLIAILMGVYFDRMV